MGKGSPQNKSVTIPESASAYITFGWRLLMTAGLLALALLIRAV